MSCARVIIFAKAPLPGLAKTRLIPALGAEGAAQLASRMLAATVTTALSAELGPVELCVTPAPDDAVWRSVPLPAGVLLSDQGDGDLGQRLARAAGRVLDGGDRILLIGTDCPALDAARLREAARSLRDVDACLIPTVDGGYALLGLNRFHPSLFEAMPWSTDAVAMETRRRLARLGWRTAELPALRDIDTPDDLRFLPIDWPETIHA